MTLHYRFHGNLKELSISKDEYTKEWVYAGGSGSSNHVNYFHRRFPGRDFLPEKDYCLCSHFIVENCYIENILTNELVIVGNCCIKKFLPSENASRTCGICKQPHKNRTNNLCNQCRAARKRSSKVVSKVIKFVTQDMDNMIYSKKIKTPVIRINKYNQIEKNVYLLNEIKNRIRKIKDNKILVFGKHRGKTYKEVSQITDYTEWVKTTKIIYDSPLYWFKKYLIENN